LAAAVVVLVELLTAMFLLLLLCPAQLVQVVVDLLILVD
jgi:hypothetical protein